MQNIKSLAKNGMNRAKVDWENSVWGMWEKKKQTHSFFKYLFVCLTYLHFIWVSTHMYPLR